MALEHAQEYLAKVLPWPQEGEPAAYVNIHWTLTKLNSHTGKPIWTGRACRSVQEAANTVSWALSGGVLVFGVEGSMNDWFEKYVLPIFAALMLLAITLPFLGLGIAIVRWALK
jgi:hypothetical protein